VCGDIYDSREHGKNMRAKIEYESDAAMLKNGKKNFLFLDEKKSIAKRKSSRNMREAEENSLAREKENLRHCKRKKI
jgi:hypothetical protein